MEDLDPHTFYGSLGDPYGTLRFPMLRGFEHVKKI